MVIGPLDVARLGRSASSGRRPLDLSLRNFKYNRGKRARFSEGEARGLVSVSTTCLLYQLENNVDQVEDCTE